MYFIKIIDVYNGFVLLCEKLDKRKLEKFMWKDFDIWRF